MTKTKTKTKTKANPPDTSIWSVSDDQYRHQLDREPDIFTDKQKSEIWDR